MRWALVGAGWCACNWSCAARSGDMKWSAARTSLQCGRCSPQWMTGAAMLWADWLVAGCVQTDRLVAVCCRLVAVRVLQCSCRCAMMNTFTKVCYCTLKAEPEDKKRGKKKSPMGGNAMLCCHCDCVLAGFHVSCQTLEKAYADLKGMSSPNEVTVLTHSTHCTLSTHSTQSLHSSHSQHPQHSATAHSHSTHLTQSLHSSHSQHSATALSHCTQSQHSSHSQHPQHSQHSLTHCTHSTLCTALCCAL